MIVRSRSSSGCTTAFCLHRLLFCRADLPVCFWMFWHIISACISNVSLQLPVASGTFLDLINALADDGYREGIDLFGAPYDFRLAADGLEQVG